MSDPANWSFETRQIHAGQTVDAETGARALPLYQTTSFVFPDAETASNRFALADLGPLYTRLGNPTQEAVEKRIAALEGGVDALLLASGQAAETLTFLNLAQAGDHFVASPSLYGGTYNLLSTTLPRYGITTTFVSDPTNLDTWREAIQPNTKALYGETIANPGQEILDIEGLADIAHSHGIPLIADNTIATPYLLRPIEWGADFVIHSATKYLGGHGTAMGGSIVDSGNFDFAQSPEKFPGFNEPDTSYNGIVFARDVGVGSAFGANLAFILKTRVQLLRDMGPAISPFNAWLLAQGLETLSLRMGRHVENTRKVAEWLDKRDDVESIKYASLPSSPHHALAEKYVPLGSGAVLSFEIKGGLKAGEAFVDALTLHSHVANIGDVRSLVIHPGSTTHSQLSESAQRASGVTPGLVRLAVGLEGIDDILTDLETGFAAAAQVGRE